MHDPKHHRRAKLTWIFHAAIFLFGGVGGLGLIYLVQPPPSPRGSLLYDITLFSSEKPISDFMPYVQMLQYNGAQGVRLTSGGGLAGNIHFSTSPKAMTRFNLALANYTAPFTTLNGLEFEVRGEVHRDRIQTQLKIAADGVVDLHHCELRDGEYRVIEVVRGKTDDRQWCYAILRVDRVRDPPPRAMVTPVPIPAGADTQVVP